jgi:ribosome-associated protein
LKPAPSNEVLDQVLACLDGDKAEDVVVIDLACKTDFADFMVIATGSSARMVGAMSDHIIEKLKARGRKGIPVEGKPQNDWVLIDAGDVIVHLFRPEIRRFYDLEKIWGGPVPQPGRAA